MFNFLEKYTTTEENNLFDYYHSCVENKFLTIMNKYKICTNNDRAIYLFYGRPVYKPHIIRSNGFRSKATTLVCIVLKKDFISNINGIYPFDTGGYTLYGLSHDINKYNLGSQSMIIRKFISAFFNENMNYYDSILSLCDKENYTSIIKDYLESVEKYIDKKSNYDSRCHTLELHIEKTIDLLASHIEKIYLTGTFFQHNKDNKFLETMAFKNKIDFVTFQKGDIIEEIFEKEKSRYEEIIDKNNKKDIIKKSTTQNIDKNDFTN